jgi:hypothetical protein
MANRGRDIRLGDDKRPVSIIPGNEDVLYNIQNGELLVDEFGRPLVTRVDQFFTADTTSERSTSVTFPETTSDKYDKKFFSEVGIHTATYNVNLDVRITSATVLPNSGSAVGFGTTVALAAGGFVTVSTGASMTDAYFAQFPFLDVKSRTDQGGVKNKLYFEDTANVNPTTIKVGDKVSGTGIVDGTRVSKVYGSRLILSKETDPTLSGVKTLEIDIDRATVRTTKSDNIFKVAEVFKESSEVSSSLLGIPRAETQLSLFSNVSSYGLNDDEFEFFTFVGGSSFGTWDQRANKIYGNRYNAGRREEVQESAIRLDSFAVPYSFPFGPKFAQVGLYQEGNYDKYKKFIDLGNKLYTQYLGKPGYGSFAQDNFLNPLVTTLTNGEVDYVAPIAESFAAIDTWTDSWRLLTEGLVDPVTNEDLTFGVISTILGESFDSTDTRPGYSDTIKKYSFLQSRRVFRYQPGRISGFTFGLRASNEPVSGAQMEWGIKNPTDQYIFRMDAGVLSIIRRSTVPLPTSALARSGLVPQDQKFIPTGDIFDVDPETGSQKEYYTIEVPRDNFNGDALDGNGPSGYNIQPENVTMYKIEFGWYGAIGCRFYAYIPAGPGEARWVVMHTFVIENSISQPCLEDSYFRLVYTVDVTTTRDLREPVYLYKYGASYYIDGGDDGTQQIYSTSSGAKNITTAEKRSLIGIQPKGFLQNSTGVNIKNKKLIIPNSVNLTSDCLAQVEVVKCRACPGFGHVYTPGVGAEVTGRSLTVQLETSNTLLAVGSGTYFQQSDVGAKVIAPSIWDAYITSVTGEEFDGDGNSLGFINASIKGFGNAAGYPALNTLNYDIDVIDQVTGAPTTVETGVTYPHPIRLSNPNDHYFASDFKFTGNKIEIQYLNPNTLDSYNHFADFHIGITDLEPQVFGDELLGFKKTPTSPLQTTINTNVAPMEAPYIEHTHNRQVLTEDGAVYGESWTSVQPPLRGAIDFRIPSPSGDVSGLCSRATVEVLDAIELSGFQEVTGGEDANIRAQEGNSSLSKFYLRREGALPSGITFAGGQVKLTAQSSASAAKYVGDPKTYKDSNDIEFGYIEIDSSVTTSNDGFSIDIRPVKISATGGGFKQKLFNFDPFPLYFFAKLSDNATIHNISMKETTGGFQRTIAPRLYKYGANSNVILTNTDNFATPPTNFEEVTRLSSAVIDVQNRQTLRPTTSVDTVYIGADQTLEVDMSKTFGQDRNVITPDNQNIEATFLVARKLDSTDNNTIEATLNYKEQ